jgi:hypothetical protein
VSQKYDQNTRIEELIPGAMEERWGKAPTEPIRPEVAGGWPRKRWRRAGRAAAEGERRMQEGERVRRAGG